MKRCRERRRKVHFDVRRAVFPAQSVRGIVRTLERVGAGSFCARMNVRKNFAIAREQYRLRPCHRARALLSHVTYKTDPFAQSTLGSNNLASSAEKSRSTSP